MVALVALAADALAAPMEVVVRVDGRAAEPLLGRVRGQSSDLSVVLDVQRGPLEASLREQIAAAAVLARSRGAGAIVWFVAAEREVVVHVMEPGASRVLVRRVSAEEAGARGRSAMLEAAAVVVRGALRALSAGGEIGVVVTAAPERSEPPARPLPPPVVVAPAPAVPPLPVVPPAAGATFALEVSGQVAADGAVQHAGLGARLERRFGRLAIGLGGATGPAAGRDDGRTVVELARHHAAAAAGYALTEGDVRLSLGLAGGVVAYQRSTTVVRGLQATPGRTTLAGLVSPEVRLGIRLAGPFGIVVWAAADVVAGAPELVYETAAGVEVRDRLWTVQPRVGLGVSIEGP